MRHVDKEVAGLVLPDLERSEAVFEVDPIAAWVKDDLISIKFLIALVFSKRFSHDVVITTPDSKNLTWDLGTATNFRSWFFSPGKHKFFFEEDAIEILPQILIIPMSEKKICSMKVSVWLHMTECKFGMIDLNCSA